MISQGLLDAQPGLAEVAARRNQGSAEDTAVTEATAAAEAAVQRPPVSENEEPPVGESETTEVVGLRAEVVQLKAQQAEDTRELVAMDAKDAAAHWTITTISE